MVTDEEYERLAAESDASFLAQREALGEWEAAHRAAVSANEAATIAARWNRPDWETLADDARAALSALHAAKVAYDVANDAAHAASTAFRAVNRKAE